MTRDEVIEAAQAWVDATHYLVDNLNGNPREGRGVADELDACLDAKAAFIAALDKLVEEV